MNPHRSRFAVRSNRVCTPDGEMEAAVLIDGEKIEAVLPIDSHETQNRLREIPCEDLGDLVISPGIIDAHVHVNEPGRTEWEGFQTATKAAIAGGTTLIVDMPLNSHPVTTSVAALAAKQAAAQNKCWCDVGFYGGLVPGNIHQIEPLIEAGVFGIKAFLCDSGLEEFPAATEADLRMAMPIVKLHGVPLLAHAELVDHLAPPIIDGRSYEQYLASRPDRWETNAIDLLIRLCEEFDAPVHIVHLSTAAALDMLAEAKQRGVRLTVETCPHYLFFTADQIPDGDTRFKCAPPIRAESNRTQLMDALTSISNDSSNTGLIDTVGSDHSPCLPALKRLDTGDFETAWGGVASLQLTLPVLWTATRKSGVSLCQIAELLSRRPAQLLRLQSRKGSLLAGLDADLCVWDPDEEWTVDPHYLHHRHAVTPYAGRSLFGAIKRTYLRGEPVDVAHEPRGVAIRRT